MAAKLQPCRQRLSASITCHETFRDAATRFLENGRVEYNPGWGELSDAPFNASCKEELLSLLEATPHLDANFHDYLRVILEIMANPKTNSKWSSKFNLVERKSAAEEEAQKLRNLCRHSRREWYKPNEKQVFVVPDRCPRTVSILKCMGN